MNEWRGIGTAAVGGFVAATLMLAGSASAVSGQATDSRWLPWLGCWTSTEGVEEGGQSLLCISPATAHAGVEVTTISADGQVVGSEAVRGDGVERELEAEGCEGYQVAEFSSDATRLYVSAEQVCEGGVGRTSKGVFAMVTPYEWVDVQAVDTEGEGSAWAMRYRAVSDERAQAAGVGSLLEGRQLAARSARIAASRSPDVADVVDVHEHVGAEGAKAWVVEMNSPMGLDSDRLVELADTGVPSDVIDVVVAVSYPTRFTVDRGDVVSELEGEPGTMYGARVPYYGGYGINRWDPFYYRGYYSPFGYGLGYGGYGYGGYGYGSGFGYGGYYGYRPTVIRVEPRSGDGMRVVNGRGWTRSQSSTGSGSSGGAARAPARRSTGSSAGSTPAPSQRSSPGASRGGSSNGGSSTGRTARPRSGND